MLLKTLSNPKLPALEKRLGVDRCTALGALVQLWALAAQHRPDGDIGRFTDEEIASTIDWRGDAGELIDGLVHCRWLDRVPEDRGRLVIHDWDDHKPEYLRRRDRNAKKRPNVDNHGQPRSTTVGQRRTTVDHGRTMDDHGQHVVGFGPLGVGVGVEKKNPLTPLEGEPSPSKVKPKKASRRNPIDPSEITWPPSLENRADCRQALEAWLAHKAATKKPYLSIDSVNRLLKQWADRGPALFVSAVDWSIANNWSGIHEPSLPAKTASPSQPEDSAERAERDQARRLLAERQRQRQLREGGAA